MANLFVPLTATVGLSGAITYLIVRQRQIDKRLDVLDDDLSATNKAIDDHVTEFRRLTGIVGQMNKVLTGVNVRSQVTARRVFADREVPA